MAATIFVLSVPLCSSYPIIVSIVRVGSIRWMVSWFFLIQSSMSDNSIYTASPFASLLCPIMFSARSIMVLGLWWVGSCFSNWVNRSIINVVMVPSSRNPGVCWSSLIHSLLLVACSIRSVVSSCARSFRCNGVWAV